jgi:Ca-activated chloride channel family protein
VTLSLRTDRKLIRAEASSTRYVLLTVDAPEAPLRTDRLPVNVALVLDRSGSMQGENKFGLAREAVEQALNLLSSDDRFTLVVYDDVIDVLSAGTLATPDAKRRAVEALSHIGPRGSTDLCSGWLRGCEGVAQYLEAESVSRVLLLTDGLANVGIQDHASLVRHARELRERGIATSTFGVGTDFDERLLRDMAHEGGGNFYFIGSAGQIVDILTSELGETLETVVRSAAIEISLPVGAHAEVLTRFRAHQSNNVLRVELGNLISAQQLQLVVAIRFARGTVGDSIGATASLTGAEGIIGSSDEIRWEYASHSANDAQPRDRVVDREVAKIYAARARAEATEANRHGDMDRARRVLQGTVKRIREYAGDDRELNEVWRALQEEASDWSTRMDASLLKAKFFSAEVSLKDRLIDGKGRKRVPR